MKEGRKEIVNVTGRGARGRHHNDFFRITFIVHNQKSNGGVGVGVGGRGGGGGAIRVHGVDLVTPLIKRLIVCELEKLI